MADVLGRLFILHVSHQQPRLHLSSMSLTRMAVSLKVLSVSFTGSLSTTPSSSSSYCGCRCPCPGMYPNASAFAVYQPTDKIQRCSTHLPILPTANAWTILLRVWFNCRQPARQGRLLRQGPVNLSTMPNRCYEHGETNRTTHTCSSRQGFIELVRLG